MTTLKENAKGVSLVADILKQRGIYNSLTRYDCHIVGNTLEIPLYGLDGQSFATRVKDFTPDTQYKYFVCYLANGEPSTLALLANPVYHNSFSSKSKNAVILGGAK